MPTSKRSAKKGSQDDPPTMVSTTGTPLPPELMPKDDGKKKKKKKLTKAEKALAKLEKSCDTFRKSGRQFTDFLDRLDIWLIRNNGRVIKLCKALDPEDENAVTYDEFKSVLFDLGAPCGSVESHLLCQLLDIEEEEAIDYTDLAQGLKDIRARQLTYTEKDYRPSLEPTFRNYDHCPSCKMAIWDGQNFAEAYPRYMLLRLRLVTFDGTKEHSGHIEYLAHSHLSVQGIMDVIRQQTALLSSKLAIFTDKSRSRDAMLPLSATLEDLGYDTGTRDEPTVVTLFYDYVVEFTDCPLLMCDHYF